MNISLSAFVPENLVSRDGFGSSVPRQPAHLHTQAEYDACLRDSSRVPRRRRFILLNPPYAIVSVPSLSDHAIVYRWRSLPRVRRHRASKPQGNSERVLPSQVTMDHLICASLSHTHLWYEVGMLKVSAEILPAKNQKRRETFGEVSSGYKLNPRRAYLEHFLLIIHGIMKTPQGLERGQHKSYPAR